MNKLLDNPINLLLTTGFLLGLNLPLGKIASEHHVSPLLWALLVSLGGVLFLFPILLVKRKLQKPTWHMVRFSTISGIISFALPNLLIFGLMAYVGSGYMGLMYALSPVFTLFFAILFQMKTPGRIGVFGVCLGFVGAVVVALTRGSAPDAPALMWILAGLIVPLSIGSGNIYRSLDWPDGATPDMLALGSHIVSVFLFVGILLVQDGNIPIEPLYAIPEVTLMQLLFAGLTFPVLFRLQQKGGPVLLSQIGYVAAAVSLIAATTFIGETYPVATWLGAVVIAIGIFFSILAQVKTPKVVLQE